jgi:hypothetical protein
MATYKGIQGFTIQNLSADPSNPIEGQVWYNSTSNVWKVEEATTVGAWATGGNLNTARYFIASASAGTQTAALGFGGTTGSITGVTESYNGTSWSPVTSLSTARNGLGGAGIQTAAVAFAGNDPVDVTGATEEWNGSSWTSVNSMNTARYLLGGTGIQTAALAVGGTPPTTGATEEYDGT